MRRSILAIFLALGLIGALASPAPAAAGPRVQVGVGRADITPPTGYYMMGWVRSDGLVVGQHTRLWARVVVLRKGKRKLALVAEDLNGIPGGMLAEVARRLQTRGFSQRNILDSASHTHAAPTGFYNFSTFNTVFMTINSPADFQLTGGFDPQLYAFMVRRLTLAIRRADDDLGPGAVGWGAARLTHLTRNRSLEAHLYDHGIHLGYGEGKPQMDPEGAIHTIDPRVDVLRVDKLLRGRRMPVGVWSTFADHGTVNKFQFNVYNEDHHGAATYIVERAIRRAGRVPRGQAVVNAYGNTDEGDMSAGLNRSGPAAAARVGGVEAHAFLAAWRRAGRRMTRSPALALRWTRMCWCGQQTHAGPVADQAAFGLAEFTGSEEGRGPLFDVTRVPFEGDHMPVGMGPQGDKQAAPIPIDVPKAVPLTAARVGDRMIVSVPGEMTEGMGRRVRASVMKASGRHGIARVVISGLANEYADYFTSPQEYDAQHYEGAATVYGRASSVAIEEVLVRLARALVGGKPGPKPYVYDPRNGIRAGARPFSKGAKRGRVESQPQQAARRLAHPSFQWTGGPKGTDRPLDRAFVLIQRRTRGRWRTAQTDLGLQILWTVGDDGSYRAEWEPSFATRLGRYRFVIHANRYLLRSHAFRLRPAKTLVLRRAESGPRQVAFTLAYPKPHSHEAVGDPPGDLYADLTDRPATATVGHATVLVNGFPHLASLRDGRFTVAAHRGDRIEVRRGAARDRYGNANRAAIRFRA